MEAPLPHVIEIAFDCWTLRRGWVDLQVYQDSLIDVLPNNELKFSIAPGLPQSVGMPFAINRAGGVDASMASEAAKEVWATLLNTAMTTTDTEPDVVRILGDQIKVGYVTVSRTGLGLWNACEKFTRRTGTA